MNNTKHPTLLSDMFTSNFGEIVNEMFAPERSRRDLTAVPSIDFTEQEKNYLLSVSLPGMHKEDVEIKLDDNTLSITAERKETLAEGDKRHIQEIRYGKYSRKVRLPKNANANKVEANYENGILTLNIAKKKENQPKMIEIK